MSVATLINSFFYLAWYGTWSETLDTDSNLSNFSIRQVIPNADISVSGSQVRVTFESGVAAGGLTVNNASIVERSGSSDDGTTTPTELLFSAGSGFVLGAGSEVTSDALVFNLDKTKDYLVIIDISNDAGNQIRYVASGDYYYKSGDASYDQQNVTGYTADTATISVNKIEVLA